jgi:hypothetical protein
MKVRKNTAAIVVLTFFGAVFVLLSIGTVAIIEEAETSQQMNVGLFLDNAARNRTDRGSDNLSQAPPLNLPIGNDKEAPFPRDFLSDSLRKGNQFIPDRFESQERGI